MPEELEIRHVRTEQGTRFDASGGAVAVYRVYFKVGDNGPFVEEFTPSEFIPEVIRTRLARVATTLRAL
jgi:hypothetical protein